MSNITMSNISMNNNQKTKYRTLTEGLSYYYTDKFKDLGEELEKLGFIVLAQTSKYPLHYRILDQNETYIADLEFTYYLKNVKYPYFFKLTTSKEEVFTSGENSHNLPESIRKILERIKNLLPDSLTSESQSELPDSLKINNDMD